VACLEILPWHLRAKCGGGGGRTKELFHYFCLVPKRKRQCFRTLHQYHNPRSRCNIGIQGGRPGFDPRQRQMIFLLASASRSALGLAQPPIQWVPGFPSPRINHGLGVTLTTHSTNTGVKNQQELYLPSPHLTSPQAPT
jgi:hypothetical protein